jgi:lipopolysaccharide export system protein LptA
MRRLSVLLSSAAIILAFLVAYTYVRRSSRDRKNEPNPPARIDTGVQATATKWHWGKDDPQTNCPVVRTVADSFRAIHDPATFELKDMQLKLFNKGCSSYTYVQTAQSEFNVSTGVMTSKGDVLIIMDVPAAKAPDDKEVAKNNVHVRTSGVTYETKSGKADTDQPAQFQFANGRGQAVGTDYDPNTHQLHMKSQVSLDWTGKGPIENAMHIESGQLRYEEKNEKIYLWPWSRLKRNNTVINAANSEVTLVDGVLHEVDSMQAVGTDEEENRHIQYGADRLVALFNDYGNMTQITGEPNAHLVSQNASAKTQVTANRAILKFEIKTVSANGTTHDSSILHEAFGQGNAVVESSPIPQPPVPPADTRILRSQSIAILMKPGGQEIESLRTDAPGQLEFKPNQPARSHRWMDGDTIRVTYGADNSVDSFYATKVKTRTEKPLTDGKPGKDGNLAPPPPSFTWSDELVAKFSPKTNDLATLEQTGHFRYEEGVRHASAGQAHLQQIENMITLSDAAKVWDDTGVTSGDIILLNQKNGDMDANGHVASTRQPDRQKGSDTGSLLDQSQPVQARAEKMKTSDDNLKIQYAGHAVLWQGANRIQADRVDIDRDAGTLHAVGNVVSQFVDKQDNTSPPTLTAAQTGAVTGGGRLERVVNPETVKPANPNPKKKSAPVIYTMIQAPDLLYNDDNRLAHYTGGVKLVRDKLIVTSKELRAFLTPANAADNKGENKNSGTSLDHAFADGDVVVTEASMGRTRTGTSQHCEYYPQQDKMIMNGGLAKMADSRKGTTAGEQLTFYSNTNRVIVEGSTKKPAISDMMKGK